MQFAAAASGVDGQAVLGKNYGYGDEPQHGTLIQRSNLETILI